MELANANAAIIAFTGLVDLIDTSAEPGFMRGLDGNAERYMH
jgi:hypothetical protein